MRRLHQYAWLASWLGSIALLLSTALVTAAVAQSGIALGLLYGGGGALNVVLAILELSALLHKGDGGNGPPGSVVVLTLFFAPALPFAAHLYGWCRAGSSAIGENGTVQLLDPLASEPTPEVVRPIARALDDVMDAAAAREAFVNAAVQQTAAGSPELQTVLRLPYLHAVLQYLVLLWTVSLDPDGVGPDWVVVSAAVSCATTMSLPLFFVRPINAGTAGFAIAASVFDVTTSIVTYKAMVYPGESLWFTFAYLGKLGLLAVVLCLCQMVVIAHLLQQIKNFVVRFIVSMLVPSIGLLGFVCIANLSDNLKLTLLFVVAKLALPSQDRIAAVLSRVSEAGYSKDALPTAITHVDDERSVGLHVNATTEEPPRASCLTQCILWLAVGLIPLLALVSAAAPFVAYFYGIVNDTLSFVLLLCALSSLLPALFLLPSVLWDITIGWPFRRRTLMRSVSEALIRDALRHLLYSRYDSVPETLGRVMSVAVLPPGVMDVVGSYMTIDDIGVYSLTLAQCAQRGSE